MKTVALPPPFPSFPEDAYDRVNERVAKRASEQKSAWHGFAASWNAVVYRLTAAHDHANRWGILVAEDNPSFLQRYEQEHELFCWAASAQSSIECASFAAMIVGRLAVDHFVPSRDEELRFSPRDVVKELQGRWPSSQLADALSRMVGATQYAEISDLRRVLFHRGSLPRRIFFHVGSGRTMPDAMPANPGDPADQWRYELPVTPTMLDAYMNWCDIAVREAVEALDDFSAKW